MVRGIRGATTVQENSAEQILEATRQLLEEMVNTNQIRLSDIAAVHFSLTPDLNSAFPALAARKMGWHKVPLFCHAEIAVPGALPRCIRVLMLVNTTKTQDEIKHIYLKESYRLRDMP